MWQNINTVLENGTQEAIEPFAAEIEMEMRVTAEHLVESQDGDSEVD